MHIFLLLEPGRNNVRAGLAEPLMESNCLLPEPGCTWMSHRFSCLQELPLLQDREITRETGEPLANNPLELAACSWGQREK